MSEAKVVSFEVVGKTDRGKSMFDETAFPSLGNLDQFRLAPHRCGGRGPERRSSSQGIRGA